MPEEEDNPAEDAGNNEAGEDSSAPVSKVEEAKQLLAKIEKANSETKQWVERAERLRAEEVVSGRSEAGMEPKKKSKDDEISEAANKILEGSGMSV